MRTNTLSPKYCTSHQHYDPSTHWNTSTG